MAEDTSCHLPATTEQQKQIEKLLKKYPNSKDTYEYQDYIENLTRGNADAFIGSILELHGDAPRRDIYLKYISERPGVERLAPTVCSPMKAFPLYWHMCRKK